jgi:DNA-binding transcriptional LysR family regulator
MQYCIAMEWNDLSIVLAIYRSKTLSGAARVLSVNQSTISRALQKIEAKNRKRLFYQSAGKYEITPDGRPYVVAASKIEETIESLNKTNAESNPSETEGRIRLTTIETLVTRYLVPRLGEFTRAFPRIEIELNGSDATANLNLRQFDAALRLGRVEKGESLMMKKLGEFGVAGYSLSQSETRWLGYEARLSSIPEEKWLHRYCTKSPPLLRVSGYSAMHQAILQGLGAGLIPCFLGDETPRLKRVTGQKPILNRPIWFISHRESRNQQCLQIFARWLFEIFDRDRIDLLG